MPTGRYPPPQRGQEPPQDSLGWQLWVTQGVRDAAVYLERWAAFDAWCRAHDRSAQPHHQPQEDP